MQSHRYPCLVTTPFCNTDPIGIAGFGNFTGYQFNGIDIGQMRFGIIQDIALCFYLFLKAVDRIRKSSDGIIAAACSVQCRLVDDGKAVIEISQGAVTDTIL